jgi:hypothetical protein
MLTLHGTPNAAEFRGGIVVEAAIGFDLAAQEPEERTKVMVEEWGRKLLNTGPLVGYAAGGWVEEAAPCSDTLNDSEEIANLRGFKSSSVDAGLVEERGGVKETAELEAATAR